MSNFQRGPRQDTRDFRDRDRDRHSSAHNPRGSNSLNRNNGPFNRNMPQNRLNPWEGGIAPGVGNNMINHNLGNSMVNHNLGNNRSSGGLLPTPSLPPAQGLLQQFSTQEVQLAIANNVLSALLPTLHSQQQNQVPSLLSLNANRGGLLPLNPPPMGSFPNPFHNQGGQVGQGNQGQRRDNIGPNRVRPLIPGRRPEPYNKMGNRNQRPGQKNDDLKGASASSRSAGRNAGPSPKNVSQQARTKFEDSKKGDVRKDNKKTEDLPKDKIKEENKSKETEKDNDVEKSKTIFADIPSEMFFCHVCSKRMWDAPSFSNHIKGRAHQLMMDQLEESYRLKIDLMRHEMKVDEQQKQISLERKQRQGNSIGSPSREYCTMCDLHFIGNLSTHRKNNLHQQLKSFLHPKCDVCVKECATRLEYDQHLLTDGHLKASAKNKGKGRKPVGEGIISEPSNLKTDNTTVKTNDSQKDSQKSEDAVKEPEKGNNLLPSPDNATTKVEEKKEDATPLISTLDKEKIPEYDSLKEIGTEMLQEKTGYLCRCCNRFLSSSADAKTHCRSQFHYDKYTTYMNTKVTNELQSPKRIGNEVASPIKKDSTEKLPAPAQSEEKKQNDTVQEEDDEDEEDEGNWKRRKIAKEEEKADNTQTLNSSELISKESSTEQETITKKNVDSNQSTALTDGDSANSLEMELEKASGKNLDVEKLWSEIDEDVGALLQAVKEDENCEDIPEDLEKTLLIEPKTPTPSTPRGRNRGRGGTAQRSRGRKRK